MCGCVFVCLCVNHFEIIIIFFVWILSRSINGIKLQLKQLHNGVISNRPPNGCKQMLCSLMSIMGSNSLFFDVNTLQMWQFSQFTSKYMMFLTNLGRPILSYQLEEFSKVYTLDLFIFCTIFLFYIFFKKKIKKNNFLCEFFHCSVYVSFPYIP